MPQAGTAREAPPTPSPWQHAAHEAPRLLAGGCYVCLREQAGPMGLSLQLTPLAELRAKAGSDPQDSHSPCIGSAYGSKWWGREFGLPRAWVGWQGAADSPPPSMQG